MIIPSDIIYLDIETVPATERYEMLPESLKHLWEEKVDRLNSTKSEEGKTGYDEEYEHAGLMAEFGKIVCISVGIMVINNEGKKVLYTKSFYGEDEGKLLKGFVDMLATKEMEYANGRRKLYLCGHNSKSFDFPFICRRLLINGMSVPKTLYEEGKKPWELNWIDTMELWRFGDTRYYVSLKLLCAVLGIPSPKDDIDGSEVRGVFYNEKDYDRIALYCEKDVKATALVYMKLTGDMKTEDVEVMTRTPELMEGKKEEKSEGEL